MRVTGGSGSAHAASLACFGNAFLDVRTFNRLSREAIMQFAVLISIEDQFSREEHVLMSVRKIRGSRFKTGFMTSGH